MERRLRWTCGRRRIVREVSSFLPGGAGSAGPVLPFKNGPDGMGKRKGNIMDSTLAVAIAGGCATIITAIIKFVPKRMNGQYMRSDLCHERHKSLQKDIIELKDGQKELGKDVSEIKTLLIKMNGGR